MRRVILTTAAALLVLLVVPLMLEGQDADSHPIVGTWSLDTEASSYDPGQAPQGVRRRFAMDDEGYLVSVRITVAPNGNPTFAMARIRLDGGDYPVWTNGTVYGELSGDGGPPATASFEIVDERTLRLTQKNPDGEVNPLSPNTWAVSSDGTTLTVTTTGTNANGDEVHNVEVFRRVQN